MKRIDRQAVRYLRVSALFGMLIWLIAGGVVVGLSLYFDWPMYIVWIVTGIFTAVFIMDVFIRPAVVYKVTRYGLYDDRVIVRRGFIFINTTLIPVKRIQGVTLRTGPVSRNYDMANVRVLTASTMLEMPPVEIGEGEEIQRKIMDLVKEEVTDV